MEYKLKQINLFATKKCIRNSPVDRGEQQQRLALHCTSYFLPLNSNGDYLDFFKKSCGHVLARSGLYDLAVDLAVESRI